MNTAGVETTVLGFMKVPGDMKSIEIRSYQVWKFDVIGFNPNEIR